MTQSLSLPIERQIRIFGRWYTWSRYRVSTGPRRARSTYRAPRP